MELGAWSAWFAKRVFGVLRRRAYSREDCRSLAGLNPFGACEIESIGIAIGPAVQLFN
ncbi:MAG: hypothetical protein ACP5QO_07430 [Clostridia bacterium]